MNTTGRLHRTLSVFCCLLAMGVGASPTECLGQVASSGPADRRMEPRDVLTPSQWSQVDRSLARALAWLATQQKGDGSFPTMKTGQPAVTALCVLAFLSAGHLPGEGRYGTAIDKGIDYILSCQYPNGLMTLLYPSMPMQRHNPAHTAHYNHAIAALVLSEAYGMSAGRTNRRIRSAVEGALEYAFKRLPVKRDSIDKGGWRYANRRTNIDSDLSVTSWHLMFLRSSKNAGFDVPAKYIDEALAFVRRCYTPKDPSFFYGLKGGTRHTSRGMIGAGILSLSLGGQHQTREAQQAGQRILRLSFKQYNTGKNKNDRYFYGAFYCSQAMFQLGGRYWAEFFPAMLGTLVRNQRPDGSWHAEAVKDKAFGNAYSTALAVLTISTPYQLLPVFQR